MCNAITLGWERSLGLISDCGTKAVDSNSDIPDLLGLEYLLRAFLLDIIIPF
jgi:hypothetical protein